MTLIEVVVASIILAGLVVAGGRLFKFFYQSSTSANAGAAVLEVEDEIRRNVFLLLQQVSNDAASSGGYNCGNGLNPAPNVGSYFDNVTLSTGITLNYIWTGMGWPVQPPSSSAPLKQFNYVWNRCQKPSGYVAASGNIYFCLHISVASNNNPNSLAQSGAFQYSILQAQPVIGEFYYANMNIASGQTESCSQYQNKNSPTVGMMIYTLHWVDSSSGVANYRQYTGTISRGN